MAKRIQRKRTKGWRMPEGAVYVGRPTVWGNPFQLQCAQTREYRACMVTRYANALNCYGPPADRRELELWFRSHGWVGAIPTGREISSWLRGVNLACWCPLDQPCHADVLLELANK